VKELLEVYVSLYGEKHWGANTLRDNEHRINVYILPFIGEKVVRDLTPLMLESYYNRLLSQPAVHMSGYKTSRNISPHVIKKVHVILHGALEQAVKWGCINRNPASNCDPPKPPKKEKQIWSPDEAVEAMELCEEGPLSLAIQLALGCSLRMGEILGLQWKYLDLSDASVEAGRASLVVRQELERVNLSDIQRVSQNEKSKIYYQFPITKKQGQKTVLVLKAPKTESSKRKIYIPAGLVEALKKERLRQKERIRLLGEGYWDYDLVVCAEEGTPIEGRRMKYLFDSFIQKNNLHPVVFHSLRHTSASIKLTLGDIKSVQQDTGHSQVRVLTEIYGHAFEENRVELTQKVNGKLFGKQKETAAVKAAEPENEATRQVLQRLEENPDLALILLPLLEKMKA